MVVLSLLRLCGWILRVRSRSVRKKNLDKIGILLEESLQNRDSSNGQSTVGDIVITLLMSENHVFLPLCIFIKRSGYY